MYWWTWIFLGNTLLTYSQLPWSGTLENIKGLRNQGPSLGIYLKACTLRFPSHLLWATLVILGEYKLPREEPIILLVLTLRFVTLQGKPNQSNHFKFCDLFLYSQHLYFQLTSEKKKKYKMLFNVWVACKSRYLPAFVYWACEAKCWEGHLLSQAKGQNTLGEKSQQHVVATRHSDKLLCAC